MAASEGSQEQLTTLKNGHLLPLQMTVVPVQLDSQTFFTSSIRDNSERYRRQQRLLQQAALLQLTHDAIIVTNMQDEIEFWNHGAAPMFGYAAGEAIGQTCHDLLGPDYPVMPALDAPQDPRIQQGRDEFSPIFWKLIQL